MTVIFGANLIEMVLLASDGRSTKRNGGVSDTATKIIPFRPYIALAVTGNPIQAANILSEVSKEIELREKEFNVRQLSGLSKDLVKEILLEVSKRIQPVSVKDSRCQLIFAGVDPTEQQVIKTGDVKKYLKSKNSGNGMILPPGRGGGNLTMYALSSEIHDEVVGLPFPSTYLMSFSWPSEEINEISCLEMRCWGKGGGLVDSHIRPDFTAFWQVSDSNIFFKKGLLAIALKKLIKDGEEKGIGGLPQIVSVDIDNGVSFQSYSNDDMEMIYEQNIWIQKDKKTGVIIKTLPSLVDLPSFDPNEIVDWMDEF